MLSIAPHVHIHEGQAVADQVIQLLEPLRPVSGGEVVGDVHVHALVDPVPAVAQAPSAVVAAHAVLVKGLGLGVKLGGVHMDAELGSQLGTLLHHGDHVLHAAHALAHVPVIGVAGVMALAGVALEQDQLAQAVGVQGHPLDVVQRHQEGVLGVSAEVHADAQVHRVPHQLAVDGDVHDGAAMAPSCQSILPSPFSSLSVSTTLANRGSSVGSWTSLSAGMA